MDTTARIAHCRPPTDAHCHECGSPDTVIVKAMDPTRVCGPGKEAHYRCIDCAAHFLAIVPEPPDNYAGNGVFAENH